MKREIFLDNNATTKVLPAVRDAMIYALEDGFGNPSSIHSAGERAREQLLNSRDRVEQLLGGNAGEIVFTSSGTEANNLVLMSAAYRAGRGGRIVTISTEHSSVLKMVEHLRSQGVDSVIVPVLSDGIVDLTALDREITPQTTLVSVQWVNNETGVIQPIELIGEICRAKGIPFHTDASQAAGKLRIDLARNPVDLLTLTAHKLHGPQGVGAIYSRNPRWLVPVFRGGPQERGLRPGTENLPGIAGFGKAAELRANCLESTVETLGQLRDQFEHRVRRIIPDVTVNGNSQCRVCNTTNLCFHAIDGQALVARLDQNGIRCSQSSACTNQRPEPSYVLRAMGLSEAEAYSSVRFSFGVFNTIDEIENTTLVIRDLVAQLRKFANQTHNPYRVART